MPEMLAPAKINLFLLVGPRRADGYHPVCSLMEKVSIYDRLRMEGSGSAGLTLSGKGLPAGENTIEKAARFIEHESGVRVDASVELVKEIPVAAGLAGGSSDAAAALKLLFEASGAGISHQRLMEIAAGVGADVPFFLKEGPQLAEGIGERLTPAGSLPDYVAVVVTPETALSTADIYERFDSIAAADGKEGFSRRCDAIKEALKKVDSLASLGEILQNDLEPAAIPRCADISKIKEIMFETGAAGALMSGSGSSVFGLFAGKNEAEKAAATLRHMYDWVWVASPLR